MAISRASLSVMDNSNAIYLPSGRKRRSRNRPNKLRDWFAHRQKSKSDFAREVGCEPPYISMLLSDEAPWPSRELQVKIAMATRGEVTPNDLAGWPPRT